MTNRLDFMKNPGRIHRRGNSRLYKRGYATAPHEVWGDSVNSGATYAATSAFAGTPGDFGPAGCTTPATAAAVSSACTAVPKTAWTTGQYVQSATASTPGRAYWNGTAWVTGAIAP